MIVASKDAEWTISVSKISQMLEDDVPYSLLLSRQGEDIFLTFGETRELYIQPKMSARMVIATAPATN